MGGTRSIHETDLHSSTHDAHEAEAMHDSDLHVTTEDFVEPKHLDAPEPREGMVQRWVRYADRDGDDMINYQTQRKKGWRPRLLETVPEAFRNFPSIQHSDMGEVIAVAGCVLCEMPIPQFERLQRAKRQRNQTMNLAVTDETERASRYGAQRGYARIQRREKVSVSRRSPTIQAD